MWKTAAIAAGFAAQAASASAQSQADWRWHADDEGCTLRQQVEVGTQFEIDRTPGNDATRIALYDRKEGLREWKMLQAVTVTMEPAGQAQADGGIGPGEELSSRSVALSTIDTTLLRQLSAASAITLSHPRLGSVRIQLRSLGAAVTALTDCEDRKMRKWGIDPVAWRALAVKPIPETPPASWIDWYDYPDRARAYKSDILVVARLDLNAAGVVQNCEIVNQPPVEFRKAACSALNRKARFEPAKDSQGQGAPAPYVVQIRFGAFRI